MKNNIIIQASLSILLMLSCGSESSYTETTVPENPTSGDVKVFITTGYRTHEFDKTFLDFSEGDNMAPNTLFLDPSQRFQTIDGFGAAITGSTAYNLLKMSAADRQQFLKETFSIEEGMGQSYIRYRDRMFGFLLGRIYPQR